MIQNRMCWKSLWILPVLLCAAGSAVADPLPAPRHVFIQVANSQGVKYDQDGATYGGPNNTYYIKADGGGLTAVHITNDPLSPYGQVTTGNTSSGTFWITNTGGRGFADDVILLISATGMLPANFGVHIKSSGYTWTPVPVANQLPTSVTYVQDAVDACFSAADFIYGPETWKPGPGSLTVPSLPLYYQQDIDDPSTQANLMFVDLGVGNLAPDNSMATVDYGAAKVEFEIQGLESLAAGTVISFNTYAWTLNSNQGQGISWTNRMIGIASSNYMVVNSPSTSASTKVLYEPSVEDLVTAITQDEAETHDEDNFRIQSSTLMKFYHVKVPMP